MKAQESVGFNRSFAENELASGDVKRVCGALLSVAFQEPDWQWAQEKFLALLESESPDVRGLSATCLGHIARIHGKLDKGRVVAALNSHLDDKAILGQIEDALDDIAMFVG